ncbi:hypothetical protein CYMTET_30194, partial [Cymbomonas tetramitiformis]
RYLKLTDQTVLNLCRQADLDDIVSDLLPKTILKQLKEAKGGRIEKGITVLPCPSGDALAEYYDDVTVMFVGISNFEELMLRLTPPELLDRLHHIWSIFDALTTRQVGADKLEAIANTYVVVSGCPKACDHHAEVITNLADQMMNAVNQMNIYLDTDHRVIIKIGIHSGPVAAGVCGTLTYFYKLFGDTMNVASRMMTYSAPNAIHLSKKTARTLEQNEDVNELLVPRGVMYIKGKGEMETYLKKLDLHPRNLRLAKRLRLRSRAESEDSVDEPEDGEAPGEEEDLVEVAIRKEPYNAISLDFSDPELEAQFVGHCKFEFCERRFTVLALSVTYIVVAALVDFFATSRDGCKADNALTLLVPVGAVPLTFLGFYLYSLTAPLTMSVWYSEYLCFIILVYNIWWLIIHYDCHLAEEYCIPMEGLIIMLTLHSQMSYMPLKEMAKTSLCLLISFNIRMVNARHTEVLGIYLLTNIAIVPLLVMTTHRNYFAIRDNFHATKIFKELQDVHKTILYKSLPLSVANRLLCNESHIMEEFNDVSVCLADIVNFTPICAETAPTVLFAMMNCLYSSFDEAVVNFKLQKLDTIGDCFFVAGGVLMSEENQEQRLDHPSRIINFCKDIQRRLDALQDEFNELQEVKLRFAAHSGPVVGGVVGNTKPRYLLWGPEILVTEKLESTGCAHHLHVSMATYERASEEARNDCILVKESYLQMEGRPQIATILLRIKDGPASRTSSPMKKSSSSSLSNLIAAGNRFC